MKRLILPTLIALALSCTDKESLPQSDKNILFAPPTQAEIDLVRNNWQTRALQPTNYQLVQESQLLNGRFRLKMVAYTLDGLRQYGALLIPKVANRLPVRMLIGGFELGTTAYTVSLVADSMLTSTPFVLAIPALRGQSLTLTVNGTSYSTPIAQGDQCDAFDGATNDAIGFLNLIEQTEPNVDVNRTSVRGGSRGGTVALLAGIRDSRIKRVVGVACPTNLVTLTAQHEHDNTYQCQFLEAIKNNSSTLAAARIRLIASSPFYFAQYLPLTQLHLGINDPIVPISQGRELEQEMVDLGRSSFFELYTYSKTHEDISTNNPALGARIEAFLSPL